MFDAQHAIDEMHDDLQRVRYGRVRSTFTVHFEKDELVKEVFYSHLNTNSRIIFEDNFSAFGEVRTSKNAEEKTIEFKRTADNAPEKTYGYVVLGE